MEKRFPTFLKELREKAGFESQTKFAEACGVDNSTIARLERGETDPSPKTLMKIAPILKVELNDLMLAAGYLEPSSYNLRGASDVNLNLTSKAFTAMGLRELGERYLVGSGPKGKHQPIKVPVLGTIKAGFDRLAEQDILGYEFVSRGYIGSGEYYYLTVTGDSMVDAGIKEGYRILVKHQNYVDDGKIAVVLINGEEGSLKRVFYDKSKIILQSENTAKKYPPRILDVKDVLIQGQVIRVEFDV